MKNTFILSGIFLLLIINFSCHRNRLKTNQKELVKEILFQEKEKMVTEKAEQEMEFADTLNLPPQGSHFKENRSVDTSSPPIIINIAGNLNNIKEIKLSNIASEIRYIRLEPVPDSSFSRAMKFKYYLFLNHIIATNPCGILLYSEGGKYLKTIVKNKTTGISVSSERMLVSGVNTFIGGGTSIWGTDNSILYAYRNNINGQEYIMKYDLSKQQIGLPKQYDPENQDQIIGQGEVIVDINPKKNKSVWKYKISPELVISGMRPEYIYQSVGTFFLDKNTYAKELETTDKIVVFNNKGDTIATFNGFEEGNSMRLENGGKQLLWNNLNDTVFQVFGSNRIIPICVLNLGQYKASLEQVREIGYDLTGKIIPGSWVQNGEFIFLIFWKDAYDSPNSRKKNKVKIYHALFSKADNQLFIVKGDPLDYSPEILENNLDGGLPVWPLSYMIGNSGEVLVSLKGKDLKDRVKSKEFKYSEAPESKKKELEELAGSVSESEDILMIIK
jgi:hypothetical protein